MGRITGLTLKNYRSVEDSIKLRFPRQDPVVLLGENNVGKSNVVRALDLVLGERWPGSWEPEDHDFFDRNRELTIELQVHVEDVVRSFYGTDQGVMSLIVRYPSDGRCFFMELDDGSENAFVPNDVRDQCPCIVIGADRRLGYQLSYASKFTLLSKLMKRFHDSLVSDVSRVSLLKEKFSDVREIFGEVPEFSAFIQELQTQSDELVANLDYRLEIDFSAYDPSNFFHALHVLPRQGADVRTFDELGTGQEQMLALAFAYAYAKSFKQESDGLLVVIEEPEAHLHPSAQRWVARRIHELAAEGVQVLITTHSPAFVDVMSLEGLILLRKDEQATSATQLTANQLAASCMEMGAKSSSASTVLPFYAAAATEELLAGFFARKVILVEGPTEALALPVLLRRVGVDVEKLGMAVISCQGVGNLAKWWRLFRAYGIPCYVLFDNDASKDDDGRRRRDLLETLGVIGADIDPLLLATEWVIDSSFSVLGENFEMSFRQTFDPYYEELETAATSEFGLSRKQSKPLLARYVAERLPDDAAGWEKLRQLSGALDSLG